ncbi:CCA tRNA nucleotidyltransferase 1, mitochondrial isoform X1 [Lasioglossum baleicum]|uniref:CCA tRNA nucleotidyltransferase 1, mitochondrial isoform X1 n=2 Tax=Lasioglossum baleicum TaxID=434251 RepID=UPI003FCCDE1E
MLIIPSRINYFISHCLLKRTYQDWVNLKMKTTYIPPCRDNPVVTKLDDPIFHSLFTPELKILTELFKKQNYEIRVVGGAVRDILMGRAPNDLDFATDATPDEMKDMFEKEQIKMINNKGEKHGTVTARINDTENFEVTTLRIDMMPDGRHSHVVFTKDWKLDSLRRDFTVNSMFLDLEGNLYDYFFGFEDLQKRQIVFVGDPVVRINEDYLRIFRYFRFYGRISEQPDAYNEAAIAAIKANVQGLEIISGERIWSEWTKILSGNYAKELTLKMLECGIAKYIGLPENLNIKRFETVYDACKKENISLNTISYVALMLKEEDEMLNLHKRLKLSAFERDLALFLIRYVEPRPSEDLKFYKRLLVHWKGNTNNCKAFICELLKCKQLFDLAAEFEKFTLPRFPINGHELKKEIKKGKVIGVVIKKLKDIWLDSNFEINIEKLLQEVPRIVSEIEDNDVNKYKK